MAMPFNFSQTWTDAWEVFVLFTVPIGGGIPAGVLLAQARGLGWPAMTLLYFISDIVLACVFEPILRMIVYLARTKPALAKFRDVMKASVAKSTAHFGPSRGPLALVLISFGVDPMTGRAASRAAGHGFVTGWLIAITGDMFYFAILMASTLWLRSVLGDGTMAMVIILIIMIAVPSIIRRYQERRMASKKHRS